jgi:hypothetical protein
MRKIGILQKKSHVRFTHGYETKNGVDVIGAERKSSDKVI